MLDSIDSVQENAEYNRKKVRLHLIGRQQLNVERQHRPFNHMSMNELFHHTRKVSLMRSNLIYLSCRNTRRRRYLCFDDWSKGGIFASKKSPQQKIQGSQNLGIIKHSPSRVIDYGATRSFTRPPACICISTASEEEDRRWSRFVRREAEYI